MGRIYGIGSIFNERKVAYQGNIFQNGKQQLDELLELSLSSANSRQVVDNSRKCLSNCLARTSETTKNLPTVLQEWTRCSGAVLRKSCPGCYRFHLVRIQAGLNYLVAQN